MSLPFAKLRATGNDYIAIDGRGIREDWARLAAAICATDPGVGSDGLLVVAESASAPVRMRVFNPDGSEAEMSGNGIRLFCKFVIERGIAAATADGLRIETLAGERNVWPKIQGEKVVAARVMMGVPSFDPATIPLDTSRLGAGGCSSELTLEVGPRRLRLTCLSLGNPHAVTFLDERVEDFPLVEIGTVVERHPLFPNRTNFEIVNVLSRSRLRVRIFERGAGETQSSGTGSTAAAVAARRRGLVDGEVEVVVDGGILHVSWDGEGAAYLEGPVEALCEGTWPL